jgi:hypothetical protein
MAAQNRFSQHRPVCVCVWGGGELAAGRRGVSWREEEMKVVSGVDTTVDIYRRLSSSAEGLRRRNYCAAEY